MSLSALPARRRGLIGVEIALLAGVLAAVGVMTSISPARGVLVARQSTPAAPATPPCFDMQLADDLMIHLTIAPGTVGENTFVVSLFDAEGNPVTDASLIRMRFDSEDSNIGQSELRPELQDDDTYRAVGSNLSLPGQWRIRVSVQRPGKYDALADFEPTIAPAAPLRKSPSSA